MQLLSFQNLFSGITGQRAESSSPSSSEPETSIDDDDYVPETSSDSEESMIEGVVLIANYNLFTL